MIAVRILVGVLGSLVALGSMGSAIRTVVVPRGEQSFLANAMVLTMRRVFNGASHRFKDPRKAETVKARFAPVSLMLFPVIWVAGVVIGCAGLFWALGVRPLREAIVLSGSSLTTLGFRTTQDLPTLLVEIAEGLVGLGLVALLISFLPTIYDAFSRRETAVAKFHLRSTGSDGSASPTSMLIRRHQIGFLEEMMHTWYEWEDWFVDIEETHTSFPILIYFRSPVPERSWITSAGLALDSAALYCSALDVPADPRAQLMIQTGTLSLRRICDYFGFEYDPDPLCDDPIAIKQAEFDEAYDLFKNAGMPVVEDQQQAWLDFKGWRVNYDRPLLSIATWIEAPISPWSSDRQIDIRRPRVFGRARHQRRTPSQGFLHDTRPQPPN